MIDRKASGCRFLLILYTLFGLCAYSIYNLSSFLAQFDLNSDDDRHLHTAPISVHPLDNLWKGRNDSLPDSLSILFNFSKRFSPVDDHGDEINDIEAEIKRCERYGFKYDNQRRRRRRIFFGSLIAEDSWHPILLHAAEAKGLYHSVALIETNKTTSLDEKSFRNWRFTPSSSELKALKSGIFGPSTRVTVDFHVDDPKLRPDGVIGDMAVEKLAREKIVQRWKDNGMTEEDVGIVSDLDEFFTRDFLLAARSCDVAVFRPGQDCRKPKVLAMTRVFESSPDCPVAKRRWHHPDMMIGQCIHEIGNETLHKPGLRNWNGIGQREKGYGLESHDYSKMPNTTMFPLWRPDDFRMVDGSEPTHGPKYFDNRTNSWRDYNVQGFHMHNFFMSQKDIRNKYTMYSHPVHDAHSRPFGQLSGDTLLAMNCALDLPQNASLQDGFLRVPGGLSEMNGPKPVVFEHVPAYVYARHSEVKGFFSREAVVTKAIAAEDTA